jgi:predicted nucleic acid-binding protein
LTAVVDASVVVAALVDDGPAGRWAETLVAGQSLAAPHLMAVEAANILRRAALAGDLSDDIASLAHADLVALPPNCFPYEPFAARVWELRGAVTTYDAWYVALAESLAVPLATLDGRLSRAPAPAAASSARPNGHPDVSRVREGLACAAHPGIVFKPGPSGRRAALAGGPDVWEIAAALRHTGVRKPNGSLAWNSARAHCESSIRGNRNG